jgi:hypothetical protein
MRASEFVTEADINRRNFLKQAGNAAAATTVPGKALSGVLGISSNVANAIKQIKAIVHDDDQFSWALRGMDGNEDFFKLPFNMQFSLEDFEDFEEAMANKGIDVDLYTDEYFENLIAKHPEATLRQWHSWASKIIGRKTMGAEIFDVLGKNGFTGDNAIEKHFLNSPQLTSFFNKLDLDNPQLSIAPQDNKISPEAQKAMDDFDKFMNDPENNPYPDDDDDDEPDDDKMSYSGSATGKFVEPWTAKATPKSPNSI